MINIYIYIYIYYIYIYIYIYILYIYMKKIDQCGQKKFETLRSLANSRGSEIEGCKSRVIGQGSKVGSKVRVKISHIKYVHWSHSTKNSLKIYKVG